MIQALKDDTITFFVWIYGKIYDSLVGLGIAKELQKIIWIKDTFFF